MGTDSDGRTLPEEGEHPDWVRAREMGIDMRRLEENLRLTPEQRIRRLDEMNRLLAILDGCAIRC